MNQLLKLSVYRANRNPLAHTGRSERFAEMGWKGLVVNSASPFEMKHMRNFCRMLGTDRAWMRRPGWHIGHSNHHYGLDSFDYTYYETMVWLHEETLQEDFLHMIDKLPQRDAEFAIECDLTKEMRALLRGLNYVTSWVAVDNQIMKTVVSAESSTKVVQLRLMTP